MAIQKYDVLGRIREEQLSPELKRELRYNDQGGLSAQTVTRQSQPLFSTEWHYDRHGNIRMRSDSASGKEFYAYDVMDRLTEHTDVLGRVESFVYDAAGNRLREEIRSRYPGSGSDAPEQKNPPDTEQQHGDDGWRCHAWLKDSRDNPLEHDYNRNGQMVARRRLKPGSWQREVITERLEWDVRGQLVRLCSDTQETRYGYDGLGRRVFRKTVRAGEETAALRWFWWEGDALMCEAQETADPAETCTAACDIRMPGTDSARREKLTQLAQGLTLREYVYYPYSFEPLALITHRTGPDGGCGDKDPTAVYFYHNDVNGAPLRLTDRTGAVVWRQAESGAWSTRYRQEGLVSNPLRFQGQYYDEESGLHYNRYRYYEPESGRYISADPIGLKGGLNLYSYGPNPLSWIDPLGLTKAPVYENPGHHDPSYLPNRQVPFNSSKSVIPPNAEDLFKLSQIDPDDPKTRWTKVGEGKKSVWHRFQSSAADGSGAFHWNGSTDGVDIKGRPRAIDTKNVPRSARNMKGCKL